MPEKRRRNESKNDGKGVKKSKTDYLSIFVKDRGNESSSDDSDDGGGGTFAAFDLPSYGNVLNEESDEEDEGTGKSSEDVIVISDSQEPRPGASQFKPKHPAKNEIIFVSDPSKLPKPLSFTTPTVMKPVVIDQAGKPSVSAAPVILMNQQVGKNQVPQVQTVVVSQRRPQTANKTSPQLNPSASRVASNKQFETHVAVPMSVMGRQSKVGTNQPVNQRMTVNQRAPVNQRANVNQSVNVNQWSNKNQQANVNQRPLVNRNFNAAPTVRQQLNQRVSVVQGKSQAPVANALANAAASAIAAGMSASSIMQQVAQAAQAAAKSTVRPLAMSTPKKHVFSNLPGKNMNRMLSPVVQNVGSNQRSPQSGVRVHQNGNAQNPHVGRNGVAPRQSPGTVRQQLAGATVPPSSRNGTMGASGHWKPYSATLTAVSRKMEPTSARKLGLNSGNQPNLKQMYSMLRLKFNTKQIYDMCLWDMEHADASLMEIAINNAFS